MPARGSKPAGKQGLSPAGNEMNQIFTYLPVPAPADL